MLTGMDYLAVAVLSRLRSAAPESVYFRRLVLDAPRWADGIKTTPERVIGACIRLEKLNLAICTWDRQLRFCAIALDTASANTG